MTVMNRKQRRVIWAAIVMLFAALVFPPWQYGGGNGGFTGYGWLFVPEDRNGVQQVYVGLLFIEGVFIALAALGALKATAGTKGKAEREAWHSVCEGLKLAGLNGDQTIAVLARVDAWGAALVAAKREDGK